MMSERGVDSLAAAAAAAAAASSTDAPTRVFTKIEFPDLPPAPDAAVAPSPSSPTTVNIDGSKLGASVGNYDHGGCGEFESPVTGFQKLEEYIHKKGDELTLEYCIGEIWNLGGVPDKRKADLAKLDEMMKTVPADEVSTALVSMVDKFVKSDTFTKRPLIKTLDTKPPTWTVGRSQPLTRDELYAIILYTADSPDKVKYPALKFYALVNAWLMGDREDDRVLRGLAFFVLLYRALEKLEHRHYTDCARGLQVHNIEALVKTFEAAQDGTLETGRAINFWGFASISTNIETVLTYFLGPKRNILYQIDKLCAVDVSPVSMLPNEEEVIPLCPLLLELDAYYFSSDRRTLVLNLHQVSPEGHEYLDPNTEAACSLDGCPLKRANNYRGPVEYKSKPPKASPGAAAPDPKQQQQQQQQQEAAAAAAASDDVDLDDLTAPGVAAKHIFTALRNHSGQAAADAIKEVIERINERAAASQEHKEDGRELLVREINRPELPPPAEQLTPLMIAAKQGNTAAVEVLAVKGGADRDLALDKNSNMTAMHHYVAECKKNKKRPENRMLTLLQLSLLDRADIARCANCDAEFGFFRWEFRHHCRVHPADPNHGQRNPSLCKKCCHHYAKVLPLMVRDVQGREDAKNGKEILCCEKCLKNIGA